MKAFDCSGSSLRLRVWFVFAKLFCYGAKSFSDMLQQIKLRLLGELYT
jgi:hypothetical protein